MSDTEEPFCRECGFQHHADTPHNAQSIVYQLHFMNVHNRPPTWDDAMAHCDDTMKKLWTVVLADEGYPDTSAMVEGFFAPTNKEKEMNPESAAHILPSERLQGEDAMISERKGDENRVTLQSITDKIMHKTFIRADENGPSDEGTLTLCLLTMQNNFHIVGLAAPADRSKFDADLGQQLAFDDALRQAWRFEGYLMCEKLWRDKHGASITASGERSVAVGSMVGGSVNTGATDKIEEAFPGSETIVESPIVESDDTPG